MLLLGCAAANAQQTATQQKSEFDWRSDWEIAEGLNMQIDTQGYRYPVQVAFVTNPGSGPKDPLYYVVELKGVVKVVTNDRTVLTFAKDFMPNPQGEAFVPTGAAGLCLDPKNGYVFATFAFLDDNRIYRNGMARFTTRPGQFGLTAEKTDLFLELFKNEVAANGHTVGPCQVKDDQIYVTVGYGDNGTAPQNIHSTLGKILRMTLDFKSIPDNPFYDSKSPDAPVSYVWAYGMRNPFGLTFVGDRLFATENGGAVDRFNEIIKGENYLADGTDWSFGARAAQLFSPSIGIVHLDYIPNDNRLFPNRFRDRFVSAAAGGPGAKGPGTEGRRSILIWEYDFAQRRMAQPPQLLGRFRGPGMQLPVSVVLGPDGLYFIPLLPNRAGVSPIYKITYDPAANYPYRLGADKSPQALMSQYGCAQCHKIRGVGGAAGPPLDANLLSRLTAKLNSPDYEARSKKVDTFDSPPYSTFREARAEIRSAQGEERVRRWLPVYLQQPHFDNPEAQMPTLGLTVTEAKEIATFLLGIAPAEDANLGPLDRLRFAMARWIPDLRYRHLFFMFAVGVIVTTMFWLVIFRLRRRRGR